MSGENFLEDLEEAGCLKEAFVIPKRKLDETSPIKTEPRDDVCAAKRPNRSESQLIETPGTAKEIHHLLYKDQIPADLVAQCTMNKCGICQLEFSSHTST